MSLAAVSAHGAVITWNGGSGDWDTATNWSSLALPGASDDVVIGPGPAITVTHLSGTDAVRSIQNEQTFVLSGGSLAVSSNLQADGLFTIAAGGALSISGEISSSNLVLAGGTLAGDSTIMGVMAWTSGSLAKGAGLTVATNGVLNLGGSSTLILDGSLTNAGTVNWTGTGTLQFGHNYGWGNDAVGWIVNQAGAVFNVQNDQTMANAYGSPFFENAGSLLKSAGTNTTITVAFNNTGTVDVQSGTVSVSDGGSGNGQFIAEAGATLAFPTDYSVGSGAVLTGAGTNLLSGGTFTVNGSITTSNAVLAGATLFGNGTFNGLFLWTSGTLATGASLTVATNGVLDLGGSSTLILDGSLTNAGTVNWTGTGTLQFGHNYGWGNDAVGWIVNQAGAVFNVQNDQTMANAYGSPWFSNAGLFRKSPSVGTTTVNVAFNNTGTLDVESGTVTVTDGGDLEGSATVVAGAQLNFTGGTFTGSAFDVSGDGMSEFTGGTATLTGTVSLVDLSVVGGNLTVNGTILNLTLAGGTLAGDSTLTGVMTWTGGSLAAGASLTVATNGVLNLGGSSTLILDGSLTNAGTVNWTGTGTLQFGHNNGWGDNAVGSIVNEAGAVFNVQNDQTMANAYGSPFFQNAGTFLKSAGTNSIIGVAFNNSGTVDVRSGTVSVSSGGDASGQFIAEAGATLAFPTSYSVESGTIFIGGGTNLLSGGTFTASGSITSSNLVLAGGTLAGDSTIMGVMAWTSGSLAKGASLTVATNGVLNLGGSSTLILDGSLTNAGTVNWTGTGTLQFGHNNGWGDNAVGWIVNEAGGIFNVQNDQTMVNGFGSPYFDNAGTFLKSAGTNASMINVILTNTGLVDVNTGTLDVSGGGSMIGGTMTLKNGAPLIVSSSLVFDGATFNGVLDVGNTYGGVTVTVIDGLTLNGTVLVGSATNGNSGRIDFVGNQTLGGNGVVVFGDSGANALRLANDGTTLVIAGSILVRGQNGQIGYDPALGGPQDVAVVNQGTIAADVSGGTITINAQPFTNEGLVQNPVGALSVNVWDNTGKTIVVDTNATPLNANPFNLSVQKIRGGVITTTNGVVLAVSGGLTLDGVTVNGTVDVGCSVNGAVLTVANGLVLNGTALVGNPTNGNYGSISFAGSGVLGGNGTVVFGDANPWNNSMANALWLTQSGTTLVIGSGITVRGQNGTIGAAFSSPWGGPVNVAVVNQGTVSADVAGGTIVINGQPFSNQGLGQGINGGTLALMGAWSNDGALSQSGGALNLGGSFSYADLGTVDSTSRGVYLSGTLNNTNSTLTLNPAMGWVLSGGTVQGGAITMVGGGSFIVQSGTLDGVTVNGVLDVGNSYNGAELAVSDGLVLNGTALVGNPTNGNYYGSIEFVGNQALEGNGTVVFGSDPIPSADALWLAESGTTLVIGPGITVRGQNGTLGYSGSYNGPQNVSVVNQGTVSADVGGGTIAVNAQPFDNQGLAQGINGGTLLLTGVWSNSGTLSESGGSLNLGGSFSFADVGVVSSTNGAIYLSGTLNNTNGTLTLNGATGSWVLNGGTVRGGAVTTASGVSFIVQSGTLEGVTVNGVLDVGNARNQANLTVTNGLVLNGTALVGNPTNGSYYGGISFAGSQVLGGSGTVVFGSYGNPSADALWLANSGTTLVIEPGITVRGQNGTVGAGGWPYSGPGNVSVVNQGTIFADVAGGSFAVSGSSLNNSGRLFESASGGSLTVSANTVNTGLVEADHGAITFSGNFTQSVGTVSFGLNSLTDFGQINLTGAASAGGTLAAQLGGGYLPSAGNSFAVLNYGTNTVAFTNVSLPTSAAWLTNLHNGVLTLVVEGLLPGPITITPTNQAVAAGSTVTFVASAGGPGPFGYQWLRNSVVLKGATNDSLGLTNVTSAASGAYTVQVSNANGSVLSTPATLDVLGPPAIMTEPQSQTVGVGTTVTFPVVATGAPPLFYQWGFDGQTLPGATNTILTLTNVTRALAGGYNVVVTNSVGGATSTVAELSIATGLPCAGTPPGMVAWWRGEGNTGDYAGTNDAVFEGLAGYGPGEVGQAFLLDGVTSYLQAPNNTLWALGTNDFTIELWANLAQVNPSIAGGDGSVVFVGQDEGPGAHNRWFFGYGGQELFFYFYGPSVGPHLEAAAYVNLVTNQWYHLALAKGSGVYRAYVNASQLSVEPSGLPVPVVNAPLTIGQAQDFFMAGSLDEISIYNRALAASEIQAIYNAGEKGKCGLETGAPISLQAEVGAGRKVIILITGGQVGATLTVEASADLKQWSPIGTVLKSAGTDRFTDPAPVLPAARYYRVK